MVDIFFTRQGCCPQKVDLLMMQTIEIRYYKVDKME